MRGHWLSVATLLSVALTVRSLQFLLSSLPLNIDSFAQVAISTDILESGAWGLDEASLNSYNLKLPILPMLLVMGASLMGVSPLHLSAPLVVLVSLAGVLGLYVLAFHLTKNRAAATLSGLALAILGPYVFLSSTVMKEALGLALIPILILAFARRSDRRMRGVLAALLLVFPLIHHLAALMVFGMVGFGVLLQNAWNYWRGKFSWRGLAFDLILGPFLAMAGLWYYDAVDMEFFTSVWNPNEVALLLATSFLMAIAGLLLASQRRARPWFAISKSRLLPSLLDQKALVILGGLLLVFANARRPLFAGTVSTSLPLLLMALAYVPLTLLALAGANLYRLNPGIQKTALLSLLLAPMTVVVYALLRGLDPLSHVLLYRSIDFLDFGLAIAIGTVLVRGVTGRARAVLAAIALTSMAATLPMAYLTEDVFQVQNTTYSYEIAGMEHLTTSTVKSPQTDQRLGGVLAMLFGVQADTSLPLRLQTGGPLDEGSLLLLEGNWATRGAQVHPLPFQKVTQTQFDRLLGDNNLIYSGGDPKNPLYIVLSRN